MTTTRTVREIGADPEADSAKLAVRHAIELLASMTVADLIRRIGVSRSLLYAFIDPERWNRPDKEKLHAMANTLHADALRLMQAADALERAARRAPY